MCVCYAGSLSVLVQVWVQVWCGSKSACTMCYFQCCLRTELGCCGVWVLR